MIDKTDSAFSPQHRLEGKRNLEVVNAGVTGYGRALELQRSVASGVRSEQLTDTLLLLEHPPVITIGRSGGDKNILVSGRILQREGIRVFEIERGGDVTYHGPGQLMGYPIINLKYHRQDLHRFVRGVEQTIILTLQDLGVTAVRREGLVGVWVDGEKIASIGINVRRWVTTHGFALNVGADLKYFHLINPCGLQGVRMTSVARLLGHQTNMDDVRKKVEGHFMQVFSLDRCARLSLPLMKLLEETGVDHVPAGGVTQY